jgi:hypothetical protein
MKNICLSIALASLAAPLYAHHVPGPASATVVVSIPGCTDAACTVALTTSNGLNCREATDGTRNVTCNLPQPFRIPAAPIAGQPQFELTRTVAATDAAGRALGAEFVAICGAVGGGACDNTVQYKFQSSTIRKIAGLGTTTQQVRLDMGFTMGLLPDASLNLITLDPTVGRAHGFSSRGTFVPAGSLTAFGNTHSAAASFTYTLANNTCGNTDAMSPEPFGIAGCTATLAIPCASPLTNTNTGVTCSSTGSSYEVKNSFLTSWNAISVAGRLDLRDGVQRTCGNLFPTGNPSCRAIERGNATLTYGLRRINDRVNITASGVGSSGLIEDVSVLSAAESLQCGLHESAGGTTINPNDNGNFKMDILGSAAIDTNTMLPATTFIGLPGGTLVQADDIRYNQNFDSDGFPDAWAIFDSSKLGPVAGITCAAFGGQTITLILQSVADVTVSGTIVVADQLKGKKQPRSFGNFTTTKRAPASCEIQATVGPCNNP